MKLSDILQRIETKAVEGTLDCEIAALSIDSRRVSGGHLFVAVRGTQTDGHQYIAKAVEQGARAVLCEVLPEDEQVVQLVAENRLTLVQVDSTEQAVGPVATAFYGHPSEHLTLVGVTGTNGKTTIATLLYNMFRRMGHKAGLLSTVCNYVDGHPVPSTHTTPDPLELNQLLARMVEEGCEYCFMECSSHAIAQQRIGGLRFAGGIFTNLTRDHLDYHKTVENYRDAKKAFFDHLPKGSFAVTNADDKNGMYMVQNTKARVKTYSVRTVADYKARVIECHFEGMYLEIDGREVGVHFIGKFNVSNLLAVYAAALQLGKSADDVLVVLSTLKSVAGRLEPVRSASGITAVVDYAHTPDALENVLRSLREVLEGKQGQLITVCGAGGNRDKGKRPLMAREAARQSDRVIITSDNPRFEEPDDIIRDMLEGLDARQRSRTLAITDRREAIRTAVALARKGDIILIAGKGHEDYQEVKGVKHHFDDREVARECLDAADNSQTVK